MNHKVSRPAQELMMAVAMNCTSNKPNEDLEVISNFLKLRFKNKPNINLFQSCIRELVNANREANLPTLIKMTVFNELSNARNPNNMAMLNVMFGAGGSSDLAAASLASVFVDLLLQKDCYLRALRMLLREIVRSLRYDAVNLYVFCKHLMLENKMESQIREFEFKERFFTSVVDLVVLSVFLGVTPPVRESINAHHRGERKDLTPYKAFLRQTAMIQRDAVVWMYENVLSVYNPEPTNVYLQSLRKLLFLITSEDWPTDQERVFFQKAISEIPLYQDTLLHLLAIGMSRSHPLNGRDTIDMVELLVMRAASLHHFLSDDFVVLGQFTRCFYMTRVDTLFFSFPAMDKPNQVIDCLFQLAAYTYPDSITLPADYSPPSMAIATAYWKVWQILIIICSHNAGGIWHACLEELSNTQSLYGNLHHEPIRFPSPHHGRARQRSG